MIDLIWYRFHRLTHTRLGTVAKVHPDGVVTDAGAKIPCEVMSLIKPPHKRNTHAHTPVSNLEQIIIKCTGYEKNEAVADLVKFDKIHTNNVICKNLAYVAEPVYDELSFGGNGTNPFSSSYVEAVKFMTTGLLHNLRQNVSCICVYGTVCL